MMTQAAVTASQLRAARAMANLRVVDVARRAAVSPNTVVRIEQGKPVKATSVEAVRRALADAGIEFVERGVRHLLSDEERNAKLDRILEIGRRVARLPIFDERTPDEILGYDEDGLPR